MRPHKHLVHAFAHLILISCAATLSAQDDQIVASGRVYSPVFSPDGGRFLAYEREVGDQRRLYIRDRSANVDLQVSRREDDAPEKKNILADWMQLEGSLSDLSVYEGEFAWRPRRDGDRYWFAYVSTASSDWDILLSYVKRNGELSEEPPIRLKSESGRIERWPKWSPGGDVLVYVSSEDRVGSDLFISDVGNVMDERESLAFDSRRITGNADADTYPAWSPDGRFIAYTSVATEEGIRNAGISLIHVSDLDDPTPPVPIRLTATLSLYDETRPSWSPDGRRIAYYVSEDPDEAEGEQDIGVLQLGFTDASQKRVSGTSTLVLSGASPRPGENVFLPHEGWGRGPTWFPADADGVDPSVLIYAKRGQFEGADNPLAIASVDEWLEIKIDYEKFAPQTRFQTIMNREIVVSRNVSGDYDFAFVYQSGTENALFATAVTAKSSSGMGSTSPIKYAAPGLGQLQRGQSGKGIFMAGTAVASLAVGLIGASRYNSLASESNDLAAEYSRRESAVAEAKSAYEVERERFLDEVAQGYLPSPPSGGEDHDAAYEDLVVAQSALERTSAEWSDKADEADGWKTISTVGFVALGAVFAYNLFDNIITGGGSAYSGYRAGPRAVPVVDILRGSVGVSLRMSI